MKCTLLLILLVALTVGHHTEGAISMTNIRHIIKKIADAITGEQDIAEFKKHTDRRANRLQLGEILNSPAVRQILDENDSQDLVEAAGTIHGRQSDEQSGIN
ncbi:uncharacterized protein LOC121377563 [Gigantopelta aegis]|uniref:uncharacterized protein LOC121377563 n=1 Tax=Gigantopelta aegis TaxID=1735272 RepID=UPI001B889511|nr:uncharacterized protein LOC121377563 [Gigantopelta aegis]